MANPRFYLDISTAELDEALSTGGAVTLSEEAAHHAGRALRLRTGEAVTIFNNTGAEWSGTIEFSKAATTVSITAKSEPQRESPISITLFQALVAPEKTDWIVEKAVELGVSELILMPAERSVTKLTAERAQKRLSKLESLIVSSSEQCGRNTLMRIRFVPNLKEALESATADVKLILAPAATPSELVLEGTKSVVVAVGPEGGFSEAEIALAVELGWHAKLLGPRVMRTETAGLAAAVWLNTLVGDFR